MNSDQPLTISIACFCRLSSLGKTKTHELINDGVLRKKKVGRRTLIYMDSVLAFFGGQEHCEQDEKGVEKAQSPVHPVDSSDAYLSHAGCKPNRLRKQISAGKFSTQTGEV